MAGSEMSREAFLRLLLGEMSAEELQRCVQSGGALFTAAAAAANTGNHTYDYLGEIGELIVQVSEQLLHERQPQA